MYFKKFSFNTFFLTLIFCFFYTLPVNFNPDKQLNILNFLFTFIFYCCWLASWYLFFIKNIFKTTQQEKNSISLILVLLAVLIFYYNPLPNPENYFISINGIFIFIFSIITFIFLFLINYKKNYILAINIIMLPIIIWSFIINILNYKNFYTNNKYLFFICLIIEFALIYLIKKINKKD